MKIWNIWSCVMLLNFVKLSTLLIEKSSHKWYATPTALEVVWALWSFKIFIWSELRWWALKERNNCCPQIDRVLCVIDILIKCAWVKKIKRWNSSTCFYGNRLGVDQEREIYSRHNEDKSVISERFIKTLVAKIY